MVMKRMLKLSTISSHFEVNTSRMRYHIHITLKYSRLGAALSDNYLKERFYIKAGYHYGQRSSSCAQKNKILFLFS